MGSFQVCGPLKMAFCVIIGCEPQRWPNTCVFGLSWVKYVHVGPICCLCGLAEFSVIYV